MNEAASKHFDQCQELSCVMSMIPGDLAVRLSDHDVQMAADASLDRMTEG